MLGATSARDGEAGQTWSFRGSKSRNKVSVGEPAEGSLQFRRVLKCTAHLHCAYATYISGDASLRNSTQQTVFDVSHELYKYSKLSTTDLLVLASMKNAAKCDK